MIINEYIDAFTLTRNFKVTVYLQYFADFHIGFNREYLPTFAEGRVHQGCRERIAAHASTAVTTSSMAVLPVEVMLKVGEILEVNLYFKISS